MIVVFLFSKIYSVFMMIKDFDLEDLILEFILLIVLRWFLVILR